MTLDDEDQREKNKEIFYQRVEALLKWNESAMKIRKNLSSLAAVISDSVASAAQATGQQSMLNRKDTMTHKKPELHQ